MFGRTFLFVAIIVLGAVLPYLLSNDAWMASAETWWNSVRGNKVESVPAEASDVPQARELGRARGVPTQPPSGSPRRPAGTPATIPQAEAWSVGRDLKLPQVSGPPGVALEHLLRFDATPEWISQNWSRVSTRLADLNLQGWRVPITMGDQPADLAGSITYYFDSHRQLQRISLHGYAGEASSVVNLALERYQMRPYPHRAGDLYLATVQGQTLGALHVLPAPIVRSEVPAKRCEILLELNRRGSPYGLSREFRQIVGQASQPALET